MGVAVRAILKSENDRKGFVVCYIPESQLTPHRSVWADKASFCIRFQDGNEPCPTATLRRMFYPHSLAFVVPLLKVSLFEIKGGGVAFQANLSVANKGTASAHECYIEPSANFRVPSTCYPAEEYWNRPDRTKLAYQCRVGNSPRFETALFAQHLPAPNFPRLAGTNHEKRAYTTTRRSCWQQC